MNWHELRSPEIGALPRETIVVLPTAAVEQHGPHLPTGTDTLIAQGICRKLDEACAGRLLILPVQQIGISEHHMKFPGTLSLTHESFKTAVTDTIDCVARQGFRRVLLLNSHGGNQSVNGVIVEKAPSKWPELDLLSTSWWRVAAEDLKPLVEGAYPAVGHACEFETSVMLALHPNLVNMKAAVDDGLVHHAPELRGDLLTGTVASAATTFDRLTGHGVFGRPSKASAEKGERILQVAAQAMKRLLESYWRK
ncbi:MAG TPA: creatininase family protein [Planctomycetota bacterium]|nr:creatininase family protein [Planctomycetota bacterium]